MPCKVLSPSTFRGRHSGDGFPQSISCPGSGPFRPPLHEAIMLRRADHGMLSSSDSTLDGVEAPGGVPPEAWLSRSILRNAAMGG
jgi:hypothetical protein